MGSFDTRQLQLSSEAQALFSAWLSNLDPDVGLPRFSQSNPPIRTLVIRVCAT